MRVCVCVCVCVHLHADFVSPDDEGHLAAPGVNEAGPAGVDGDVLTVLGAEVCGRVVEGLPGVLQDCGRRKRTFRNPPLCRF